MALLLAVIALSAETAKNIRLGSRWWRASFFFGVGYIALAFMVPPNPVKALLVGSAYPIWDAFRNTLFCGWIFLNAFDKPEGKP
jgi:uncharacterized membrane protein YdjX (TVP38/TMEM64 family)